MKQRLVEMASPRW